MKRLAQVAQRDRLIEMLRNITANRLDQFILRAAPHCFRTAPQAGTISGVLSFLGTPVERDILPPRTLRSARWPAVHSSRGNGKHELAVLVAIACQHRLPEFVL